MVTIYLLLLRLFSGCNLEYNIYIYIFAHFTFFHVVNFTPVCFATRELKCGGGGLSTIVVDYL